MSSKHYEGREEKRHEAKGGDQSLTGSEAEKKPAQPEAAGETGPEGAGVTCTEAGDVDPQEIETRSLKDKVSFLEAAEAALKEEVSVLKDQYLRKLADDDNFRKRMRREVEDARKFANTALLGDLVAVLDDFDRAIGSSEHSRDFTVLHDGVSLIKRQFGQMLSNKYGLSAFDATGEVFDPNIHEALASEAGDVEEATVAEAFLPGYRLHDRVIRSAKVKVLTPRPKPGPEMAEAGSDESKE